LIVGLSHIATDQVDICSFILLLLISGYGIWFWGPVENSHKPVSKEQQLRCHCIAKCIYLFDVCLAIGCYIWSSYLGLIVAFSLSAVTFLLPLGAMTERRRKYETERQTCENFD
jgi:di/tricarboxylate transporter